VIPASQLDQDHPRTHQAFGRVRPRWRPSYQYDDAFPIDSDSRTVKAPVVLGGGWDTTKVDRFDHSSSERRARCYYNLDASQLTGDITLGASPSWATIRANGIERATGRFPYVLSTADPGRTTVTGTATSTRRTHQPDRGPTAPTIRVRTQMGPTVACAASRQCARPVYGWEPHRLAKVSDSRATTANRQHERGLTIE